MLAQRDDNHHTVYKVRRCFLWQQTCFQMDIYKVPCNNLCNGLVLLETYTTVTGQVLKPKLPTFLTIVREVTDDMDYSMYNLSMRTDSHKIHIGYNINNTVPTAKPETNGTSNCKLNSIVPGKATTNGFTAK